MSARVLLLVFGVLACSTAALFIKASATPALLIAAWRLVIAAVLLQPLFWWARRRHPDYCWADLMRATVPAAVLLALHFWSWNRGVHTTPIANATLIVNLVAPVMPVLVWVLLREAPRRRELTGTAIAFVGVLVLAGGDLHFSPESLLGDAICFASMLAFGVYLVWSRRSVRCPSLWLYVPTVYLLAGLGCFAAALLGGMDPLPVDEREWWLLLGLACIPTVIGHSILNRSMQSLSPQLVAVVNLGQFIPAGLLAWLLFAELPPWTMAVAALLVVGGALVVLRTPRSGG